MKIAATVAGATKRIKNLQTLDTQACLMSSSSRLEALGIIHPASIAMSIPPTGMSRLDPK